ncbi:MAG: hypothetical protein ACRDVG_02600 [Jatrophihabitantaceae bacterium]
MRVEVTDDGGKGRGRRVLVTGAGNAIDVRAIAALITLVMLTAATVMGAILLAGILRDISTVLAIGFALYLSVVAVSVAVPLLMIRPPPR